ncbi:mechanosensitive ion channel protein MscS [Nostoc sp. 3335mG]|nr:mechanosensitive ion channel protein MscS [Nostoc sp. 3335mG]
MANAKTNFPDHVFTPPQDLAGQSHMLVGETLTWLQANSLRIVIALAVGVVIVIALLAVQKAAQRLCRGDDPLVGWRTIIGRIAAKTSFWFLVIVAARLVDGYADTPPLLDTTIGFLFTVILTFQAAIWVRELVMGFIEHRAGGADQDHGALASAMGIIRFMVSFTVFAIALVLVLGNLGVNVTGLIAGLGVGGIAIGLAAQGIFKDLFAALAIIFDRPFRKGDSVKWNGISGTIERIGLKTTHIRAVGGELVVVGNDDLLKKEVYNLARLDHRRMIAGYALAYDTSDAQAAQVLDIIRETVKATEKCKLARVGLMAMDKEGLQYELQYDVMSANYNEVIAARTQVNLAILRRFREAGIAFADPNGKAQEGPEAKPEADPEAAPAPPAAKVKEPVETDHETAP